MYCCTMFSPWAQEFYISKINIKQEIRDACPYEPAPKSACVEGSYIGHVLVGGLMSLE